MKEVSEQNNVYAYNKENKEIHISEAQSGRKGYYCMGCNCEMQAVKSDIENRKHYFRHDPKYIKLNNTKCTYSDETYRHQLAKEILQRLRYVKVPAVYKIFNEKAYRISKEKIIEAAFVEIEQYFYEDENCYIKKSNKTDFDEKYLLFKPDVVFYNFEKVPILFIEIKATHGIDDDKFIKIKRLGIDTIEISVPKDSPEEIENTFNKTTRTKWIYNNEYENTENISTSASHTEGISSTDKIPDEFYKESFKCRSSQINNLIRSIKRCLESGEYGSIESGIRSEILRVEKNTERNREQLQRLQNRHRGEIEERYRERREILEKQKEEFDKEEREFIEKYNNLEGRYNNKRKELETKNGILDADEKTNIRENKSEEEFLRNEETRIGELILEESIKAETNETEYESTRERERLRRGKLEEYRSRIQDKLSEENRSYEEGVRRQYKYFEEREREESERIRRIRAELPGKFEENRGELEEKYRNLQTELDRIFQGTNDKESSKLFPELRDAINARKLFTDYPKIQETYQRNRTAWDCYNSGAYKNWKGWND